MQVCGGSGFTTDWSIEQYYRDLRIAMIYEGTNHIQALDLVGRKLPMGGGRLMMAFAKRAKALIGEASQNPALAPYAMDLGKALGDLDEVTRTMMGKAAGEPEIIGAVASNYLNLFALSTLGYIWLKQLTTIGDREGRFYDLKRKSAHYYFKMVLPERHAYAALVAEGNESIKQFAQMKGEVEVDWEAIKAKEQHGTPFADDDHVYHATWHHLDRVQIYDPRPEIEGPADKRWCKNI